MRRNRAYTIIYQSQSSEFKPLFSSTTNGAKEWQILHEYFEPKTRARKIQLLDVFFNTRYVSSENLEPFLCHVRKAAKCLRDVVYQLQPLYLGYKMIWSFPDGFQATVQAIYRCSDIEIVPDKIEAEPLLEEN